MPLVSVITAVHNAAEFLPAAVESILNQTFRDFEFIVIDDGSTDGRTLPILQNFAAGDARIRLVSRNNVGLTKSLNEAIGLASGEFIARMDGDDIAAPRRLELQVGFMRQNPRVVLLGGAYELIDEADRRIRVWRPEGDDATLQRHHLEGSTAICHPLAMIRADALRRVGGYDESFTVAQDLDLWLRLGEVGEMACLGDVLLRYRQHDKSVSEKKQSLQIKNMRRACEAAWKRRGVEGKYACRADDGWRPGGDRESRRRFALQFGWWAFNSGERATARHYGVKAIASQPWRIDGWKLLACTLIKKVKPQINAENAH